MITEMLRGLQQKEANESQEKRLQVAGLQIADLLTRMKQCELEQESQRSESLIAIAANAAALIKLQNLVVTTSGSFK